MSQMETSSGHHHSGSFSSQVPPQLSQDNHPLQSSHHLVHSEPQLDTRGRAVPAVAQPARNKPRDDQFFTYDDAGEKKPNHEFLKYHFFQEGRLTENQALYIVEHATNIFSTEPNMVPVKSPVTICGDIHGQYYDLMKLFDVGGSMDESAYLFLGDYVDRGDFGIECLLYLYARKIWSPNRLVMLRGNHECRHLTEYFTFKRECLHKYSETIYEACIRSFWSLPVAALVDNRFFCVHGGISPELITLDDIAALDRFQEPGSHGLLCDLLWADPITNFGHETENGSVAPGTQFVNNATRGCSFFYTFEAVTKFLERNSLLTVIRGHEAQDAGYTMYRKTPKRNFPSVITIFSAPNYLDVYHNRGAVIKYANKNITIRQYNSSSHPYWLPNFMDAFTWSLPFVGLKITEMLLAILSICSQEELDSDSDGEETTVAEEALREQAIAARRQVIKNKIRAVGKMQKVFQILREGAENATELETDSVSGTSTGVGLNVQGTTINRSIRTFADARRSDLANERIPDFETNRPTIFPVPSMRGTSRRDSEGMDMEYLIKRTLDEEGDEGDVVEKLAEKIARGRSITAKPSLKRHDTA